MTMTDQISKTNPDDDSNHSIILPFSLPNNSNTQITSRDQIRYPITQAVTSTVAFTFVPSSFSSSAKSSFKISSSPAESCTGSYITRIIKLQLGPLAMSSPSCS